MMEGSIANPDATIPTAFAPDSKAIPPAEVSTQAAELAKIRSGLMAQIEGKIGGGTGVKIEDPSIRNATPLDIPVNRSSPFLDSVKHFLNTADVKFEQLSEPLQNRFNALIEGNDTKKFISGFGTLLSDVKSEMAKKMNDEQRQKLDKMQANIEQHPLEFLGNLKTYAQRLNLPPADSAQIQKSASLLEEQAKKPDELQDKKEVVENTSRIVGILKKVGLAFAFLFGMSIFKAFRGAFGQSGQGSPFGG